MIDKTINDKRGISSSTLKIIAIIAMFIDHIGAVVLEPMITRGISFPGMSLYELYELDSFIRLVIGRIAFPIFCFQLVEGFLKTSDVTQYAVRLFIFALLSELPFNLAFRQTLVDSSYQNVFFTLFIGLMVMILADRIRTAAWGKRFSPTIGNGLSVMLRIAVVAAGMVLAEALHTDYAAYGVMCITILYFFRYNKKKQILAGSIAFFAGDIIMNGGSSELLAPLGFIAVACYNGQRGMRMKYVFYLFYPLHLLVLYGIQRLVLSGF